MKKMMKACAVTLAAILVFGGCQAGSGATDNNVLHLASRVPANNLNPLTNNEYVNTLVLMNLLDGLVGVGMDGKLEGRAAESWTLSEDKTEYTFKLRKMNWSNGEPVTAHDFVFGWQTLATHPRASYKDYIRTVENGDAVIEGTKQPSELGVRAVSDTELYVKLVQPKPSFLEMAATMAMAPVNEAFYNEVGADNYGTSKETLLANGPYVLSEYIADQVQKFTRNQHYWDKQHVPLEVVEVRVLATMETQATMYENGQLDRLVLNADLVDKYGERPEVVIQPEPSIFYLYLSGTTKTPDPLLLNKNFRAAVAHAFDKTILTENILKDGSIPADFFVPWDVAEVEGKDYREASGKFNDQQFNVAKANEYLKQAQEELGDIPLEINFTTSDSEMNKKLMENIKSQVETNLPGVTMNLTLLPTQSYFQTLFKYETPAATAGWTGGGYRDVESYLRILEEDDSLNMAQYKSAEYNRLTQLAESPEVSLDPTLRYRTYMQAEEVLLNDFVIIPMYQRASKVLIKEGVEGLSLDSGVPNYYYKYVSKRT